MKLVTVPHPILTQKAKPVQHIDKKILTLIDQMKLILEAQTNPPGVGLAAPQVGVPLRLFLMKPTKKSPIGIFINPHVIKEEKPADEKTSTASKDKQSKLEGCLSIPRIWGPVKRSPRLILEYQTLEGETRQEKFDGFEAVIIQHEIDHLNGILFTLRVLEQGADLFEEKAGGLVKTAID